VDGAGLVSVVEHPFFALLMGDVIELHAELAVVGVHRVMGEGLQVNGFVVDHGHTDGKGVVERGGGRGVRRENSVRGMEEEWCNENAAGKRKDVVGASHKKGTEKSEKSRW
jgi:hypothetical protein